MSSQMRFQLAAGVSQRKPTTPLRATGGRAPTSVLVVSDSAALRHAVSAHLQDAPGLIVEAVPGGQAAVASARALQPDVIMLDIARFESDSPGLLRRLLQATPSRVIILAPASAAGAAATVEALCHGALDVIPLPSGAGLGDSSVRDDLRAKIEGLADVPVPPYTRVVDAALASPDAMAGLRLASADKLVIIGSSLGGPGALCELVPQLPADLDAAVLIVQHLPSGFTRSLVQRLNRCARLLVKEAQTGDPLRMGLALVAPAGCQIGFDANQRIVLIPTERPVGGLSALDRTLVAAADRFGSGVVAVILTGTGGDGRAGALAVKAAGGKVIVEDPATAVIAAMPRAVVAAGAVDSILPLPRIASELVNLLDGLVVSRE